MKGLLVAAVLLASASTASAGGFVGLGVGTAPGTSGSSGFTADGRTGRLELGYSFGRFAVEGIAARNDLIAPDTYVFNDTMLAVAGMFRLPLSDGFGAYGRFGLQHTSLTWDDDQGPQSDPDFSGGGILFGGGFDFKLPIAAANLSVFVDYTLALSTLTVTGAPEGSQEYGLTTRTWTLGAKLGF